MIKFPSINQFRNAVQHVRHKASFMGLDAEGNAIHNPAPKYPTLTFMGTVKLHGTNAAIVFSPSGDITLQSRERVIVPGDDNAGFAEHFSQHTDILRALAEDLDILGETPSESTLVIYGEWCGGNIQKGVAISGLPKMFVVFAVKVNDEWRNDLVHLCNDPNAGIYSIELFPKWFRAIDFEQPEKSQNILSELTLAVEEQCPVGKHFGQIGVGEGIVWQCVDNPSSELWFKVKGEKHYSSRVKTLAAVDVEAVENISAFVKAVATDSRLEQGIQNLVNEQKKPFAMTSMGDFIRWVHNDVLKEESDTMQASGIDPKKLGGPLAQAAKRWFVEKLDSQVWLEFNQAQSLRFNRAS